MRFDLPSRQVESWVRLAYFHELREAGMTVAEACQTLGVSLPTGARLSRTLKSDFLEEEVDHDLPKQIAFMLWAGPMSRARIAQVLPRVSGQDIDDALAALEGEGRITRSEGRTPQYAIRQPEDRLVRPGWASRIGALRSLLTNLTDVVEGRFFDGSARAFARTVSFRVHADDEPELQRFYEEQLWPFLKGLEDRARASVGAPVGITRFSVFWSTENDPSTAAERSGRKEP